MAEPVWRKPGCFLKTYTTYLGSRTSGLKALSERNKLYAHKVTCRRMFIATLFKVLVTVYLWENGYIVALWSTIERSSKKEQAMHKWNDTSQKHYAKTKKLYTE